MIIEGNLSVKAALLGKQREVLRLYIDEEKHSRDLSYIKHRADEKNVPITYLSRPEIDAMASGHTHGGLLAEVTPARWQELSDIHAENPFYVLVEGIEDPFNLAYIMRTLYSAGCCGLLLRKRSWETAESTIIKASAGASEYLNVVMWEDPVAAIRRLKEQGVVCCAAMRKDADIYYEADFTVPLLLAIGGEMRGLSSAVLKEIDRNIYIPYANDFRNALNAAAATAVLAFEVERQRASALRI